MTRVLIVAYGNPLRCDDGVSWRAAELLEGKFADSEVEILRLHQLAPEVADSVRGRELVLFLDAACLDHLKNYEPGHVQVSEISHFAAQEGREGQFSHVYSPARIISLSRELYQADPKSFVITIVGKEFSHGDQLSDAVAAALPTLVATVVEIVQSHFSTT